jgi:hypothetical protein
LHHAITSPLGVQTVRQLSGVPYWLPAIETGERLLPTSKQAATSRAATLPSLDTKNRRAGLAGHGVRGQHGFRNTSHYSSAATSYRPAAGLSTGRGESEGTQGQYQTCDQTNHGFSLNDVLLNQDPNDPAQNINSHRQ